MMSAPSEPPVGVVVETVPFRDEIFDCPIASLNNVDVWDLIFEKYVTNPIDQQNLVVASPQFFGPLLKEKKCSNLFGEVLDLLHRKHYLTLSKKEFLCFRGVSKTCKKSIDRVLRINNHCFLHDYGSQHDPYDPKHVCWNSNKLTSFLTLPMLEHKIKTFSGMNLDEGLVQFSGPLPGLWIDQFDVDIYPNFEALLSPVGSQIYHLKISFDWDSDTWNEKYRVLRTLLGIMPNLISLRVEMYFSHADSRDEKWLMELRRCIEENPLPSLNRLIYLLLEAIPTELSNALLANYAAKLEKLSMAFEPVADDFLHSGGLFSKANVLTDLWIAAKTDNSFFPFRRNVKWPASLRNVCVWVVYGRNLRYRRNFQSFCTALFEQFANHRLRSLSILMEEGSHHYPDAIPLLSTRFRIRLPFLRRLWIRICLHSIKNIDFILGVSNSLEELVLTLTWAEPKQENAKELIWFNGYWHRMYESNIWKNIPRLRKLTIRISGRCRNSLECYEYIRPAYDRLSMTAASGAHLASLRLDD